MCFFFLFRFIRCRRFAVCRRAPQYFLSRGRVRIRIQYINIYIFIIYTRVYVCLLYYVPVRIFEFFFPPFRFATTGKNQFYSVKTRPAKSSFKYNGGKNRSRSARRTDDLFLLSVYFNFSINILSANAHIHRGDVYQLYAAPTTICIRLVQRRKKHSV